MKQNNTDKSAKKQKGKYGLTILWILLAGALVIGAVIAIYSALNRETPEDPTTGTLPVVTLTDTAPVTSEEASQQATAAETAEPPTEPASEETESAPETTEEVFDANATFPIDLGFAVLQYPQKWKNSVTVSGAGRHQPGDRFTVSFAAGGRELFALHFNGEEGDILGTILGEVYTTVRVTSASGLEDEDEIEMQEDVNVILEHLRADYSFAVGKILKDTGDSVFWFDTPIGALCYPTKWQDRITIDITDTVISFSDGNTPVFELVLLETEGYLLGTYDGKPVYLYEYAVTDEDQSAMQDDVNVILQKLMEDPKFEVNR